MTIEIEIESGIFSVHALFGCCGFSNLNENKFKIENVEPHTHMQSESRVSRG
jgi:hypothetical protein